MTGSELALFLGPLVGPEARRNLAALTRGDTTHVTLRYDWVRDWYRLGQFITDNVDEVQLRDGQEWFTLDTEQMQ